MAAARTAILSSSSPSSGLPWASVAMRAAGRSRSNGQRQRADSTAATVTWEERQQQQRQQTTTRMQLTALRVHAQQQTGQRVCRRRKAPSYREEPQIRSPCTQSWRRATADSAPGSLHSRRHEQSRTDQRYATIACSTRGRYEMPSVVWKLLQSRGGYGLIFEGRRRLCRTILRSLGNLQGAGCTERTKTPLIEQNRTRCATLFETRCTRDLDRGEKQTQLSTKEKLEGSSSCEPCA